MAYPLDRISAYHARLIELLSPHRIGDSLIGYRYASLPQRSVP